MLATTFFDLGGRLLRIQCKSSPRKGAVVVVRAIGNWYSPGRGYVRSGYGSDEIDAIASYCPQLGRCYLLPVELFENRRLLHLRLDPTKNGQLASLHFASDYELGAIAQLGERLAGSQKVVGSSPTGSIASPPNSGPETEVGAHEFRNRFGWYMERAAAGEQFLVRRRGKPYVHLSAAAPPLPLAA